MGKIKLISILAVGLLLSNLILVGYIMLHKDNRPPQGPPEHRGPRNLIIERLHFTDAQIAEYDKLIQWHRHEVDNGNHKIMELKNLLYGTINNPSSTTKDSLIAAIGIAQQEIERVHYKHFEDIKHLCTPQQQPAFEELTKEIASLFSPQRPPRKPR